MPFSPLTWVNKVTKLGPTNLNRIEQGIDDAHAGLIDDLAITTGKIAANAVTAAKIAANTITAAEIAADAIGSSELADNAVDTAAIVAGAVTTVKRATGTRKAIPEHTYWSPLTQPPILVFQDGATGTLYFQLVIPDDYVSGDLTLKIMLRPTVSSANNVRFLWDSWRIRDGVALSQVDNQVEQLVGSWTTNQGKVISRTFAAVNFAAGDIVFWGLNRDGAHASDTYTGVPQVDGSWVEYTGRV